MIISKITGGIGNQMFQYAFAKTISLQNNVELKLDVSFYEKQKLRKYELNFFEIKEKIANRKEIINLSGNENLWFKVRRRLGIQVNRPINYYMERAAAVYDVSALKPSKDIYFEGYWQNSRYFDKNRQAILSNFKLKKDFQENNIVARYLSEIHSVESVSLHVRRGDYLLAKNQRHNICDLDYYKRAILRMQSMIECDCVFFIFSDDISWCQDNFYFLNNKVFIVNTNTSVHDLELMKNCKHNIISNSTFSWWGAWLNEFDRKVVIAPKVWWLTNPKKTLALDSWIQI